MPLNKITNQYINTRKHERICQITTYNIQEYPTYGSIQTSRRLAKHLLIHWFAKLMYICGVPFANILSPRPAA
ncbi:19747_t:CDS:2 [Cetraspora pellucida]|uniref:19747_t:CDS:1 n=1 Tax=Cetraspora pellucida TaxID=1433469 RepID=A0A9N9H590_9GLOM|nr:19747_t:CDS:2 [Cetraspora pellucida]